MCLFLFQANNRFTNEDYETMYVLKSFVFLPAVSLISMLDMESRHIPQACLNYAYLLFGKGAFRETLHIRGKGKLEVNKELILYSQKSEFYDMALFLVRFCTCQNCAHYQVEPSAFWPKIQEFNNFGNRF